MVPVFLSKTARIILLAVFLYIFLAVVKVAAANQPGSRRPQVVTPTISQSTATQSATTAAVTEPLASSTPPPGPSTWTPSASSAVTEVGTATADPTPSLVPSTLTASPTPSVTPSAAPVPTATELSNPYPPGVVLINELAWAGTTASPHDEWIELRNTSSHPVDLTGWLLTDSGDISISLDGVIEPYGLFLLERTDDATISTIAANQLYTGAMRNSGETLELRGPDGQLIDTANSGGGGWPAGDATSRASMERTGGNDSPANWSTFASTPFALDADGNLVAGSPNEPNSPPSLTATPSATFSSSETPTASPYPVGAVLINEVAWAGTIASSSDEWIELHNPDDHDVNLAGWLLTDRGDINIPLDGLLPAQGFLLLERTDDATVRNIPADFLYSGSLRNNGETLELLDPNGNLIDSANSAGGSWPGGQADRRLSMERWGGADTPNNWGTFTGYGSLGQDADGNQINGTARGGNSVLIPTPTPTWIPGSVVLNEVLVRPHYDWEGTGGVTTGDEFIELYNRGPGPVWLRGWLLDDISGSGSKPFALPGVTISEHGYAVFFRTQTHIALNDGGDSVRLLAPNGRMIDKLHYQRVRAYNLSYGRLPNGSNSLSYGLWPTPGEPNILFVEPEPAGGSSWLPRPAFACRHGGKPETPLPRLARFPWQSRWMVGLGLVHCSNSG